MPGYQMAGFLLFVAFFEIRQQTRYRRVTMDRDDISLLQAVGEADGNAGTVVTGDGDVAFELLDEGLHELGAHGLLAEGFVVLRQADAIVGDVQEEALLLPEHDVYGAGAVAGKGPLEGIGDGFVEDEADGNGNGDVERYGVDVEMEDDALPAGEAVAEIVDEVGYIPGHIDLFQVIGLV